MEKSTLSAEPEKLHDTSPLLYGKKHYGIALADVPDDYLIWLYTQAKFVPQNLKDYIKDNLHAIKGHCNLI